MFLVAGLALPAAPAVAQQVQSFFGHDDRVALAPIRLPWQAIGKFLYPGGGHCSGTLVSDRVVLTAAHCLFGAGTSVFLDPPVSFEAGYQKGRAVGSAAVDRFWYPRDFAVGEADDEIDHDVEGLDYAFVLLDQPIGRQVGFLDIHPVTVDDIARVADRRWRRLDQAGYSADRPDQLTGHRGCLAESFLPNNTLSHRCDIMSGDSGSPIFFRSESGFRIVAVTSSIYLGRQPLNIAVDSRAFRDDLNRFLTRYDPPARF